METFSFHLCCLLKTDFPHWRNAFSNYRVKSSQHWSLGTTTVFARSFSTDRWPLAQTGCTSVSYFSRSVAREFCSWYKANSRNNYLRPIVSMIVCPRKRRANGHVERVAIVKRCQEVTAPVVLRRICWNGIFEISCQEITKCLQHENNDPCNQASR